MPHRVTKFFRAHSFDLPVDHIKNKGSRTPSSSGSSLASTEEVKMPHSGDKKRLSLSLHHSPRSSASKLATHHPAALNLEIESPPLVFYGSTTASTGALFSGQLKLHVEEENLAIETFKMRMVLEVTRKKPFHSGCKDCANQSTDLNTWNFMAGPTTFTHGEHTFPFSFLLPGHLPASMKGALSSIDYVLRATVNTKSGEIIKLTQLLDVKRSIQTPDTPRNSIRIFPPTNLTANCQLPPMVHPIGESTFSMRLDGVVRRNSDSKTQSQWRLKRVTWRLDETQKMISPACTKHAAKLGAVDEAKKGLPHQDVRTIGSAELKTGWKSDYTGPDGTVELEFPFGIQANNHPICDMKAEDGTEVSHVLVVEMIVTEELTPVNKPKQATPTGAARVLRMHFNAIVTERGGLGISWDEEQPPLYENVPASPPNYGQSDELPDYTELQPLDEIAGLSLSDHPSSQPSSSGSGS